MSLVTMTCRLHQLATQYEEELGAGRWSEAGTTFLAFVELEQQITAERQRLELSTTSEQAHGPTATDLFLSSGLMPSELN